MSSQRLTSTFAFAHSLYHNSKKSLSGSGQGDNEKCIFSVDLRERHYESRLICSYYHWIGQQFELLTRKVSNFLNKVNKSLFFKKIWRVSILFVGLLISLFWTSGDVCPGFQSHRESLTSTLPNLCEIDEQHYTQTYKQCPLLVFDTSKRIGGTQTLDQVCSTVCTLTI